MQVGIAADHGGFGLKEGLLAQLRGAGHEMVDFGADDIICLGGPTVGPGVAGDLVQTFLAARFTHAPRHERRLGKVAQLELQAARSNR